MPAVTIAPDVLIFGGGAAGLWLLDDLHRAGYRTLLLENNALGTGQTVASQGIIHGGLKYTLTGTFTPSAEAIKSLPTTWRKCLAGEAAPNLADTPLRSPHCYLWSIDSLRSKLGMFGASHALTVKPRPIERKDRPAVLDNVGGKVMQLDEQVISPPGFVASLAAAHQDRLLKIDCDDEVQFDVSSSGVAAVTLRRAGGADHVTLNPSRVVLTAGEGNEPLREQMGLADQAMQRRPVHMIVARGDLPVLNGHCVDGRRTRVTITTDRDTMGRSIWQIGGQVSEDGVAMSGKELISHTKQELATVLPGINLREVEWMTYKVNKAEGVQKGGQRPSTEIVLCENNVITVWPTKLVLAPVASKRVMQLLPPPQTKKDETTIAHLKHWPRPDVAAPPWETVEQWTTDP